MKVLVGYGSKHGSTRAIAERIAETLRAAGHRAAARPVEAAGDLAGYDAFVIGSGVYAGRWIQEATEFVRRHQPILASRPVWLFSSGPIGTMATRYDPAEPKGIGALRRAINPRAGPSGLRRRLGPQQARRKQARVRRAAGRQAAAPRGLPRLGGDRGLGREHCPGTASATGGAALRQAAPVGVLRGAGSGCCAQAPLPEPRAAHPGRGWLSATVPGNSGRPAEQAKLRPRTNLPDRARSSRRRGRHAPWTRRRHAGGQARGSQGAAWGLCRWPAKALTYCASGWRLPASSTSSGPRPSARPPVLRMRHATRGRMGC